MHRADGFDELSDDERSGDVLQGDWEVVDEQDTSIVARGSHEPQTNASSPGRFYAVAIGRRPGVYLNWTDARAQTDVRYGQKRRKHHQTNHQSIGLFRL
jgi:hypothetical protein